MEVAAKEKNLEAQQKAEQHCWWYLIFKPLPLQIKHIITTLMQLQACICNYPLDNWSPKCFYSEAKMEFSSEHGHGAEN